MPFKNPHPLYSVWQGMLNRCRNPKFKQFSDYGGRGITVCDRWKKFQNFVDDMGPKPPGHSIDRINNDGNYEPGNCQWSSRRDQQRNRRVTRRVVICGVSYVAVDLADIHGLKIDTIVERAEKGLSFDEVIAPERRVFTEGLKLGGKANGERQKSKTHCPRGHEYTAENTYVNAQGWRRCKVCRTKAFKSV